MSRVLQMKSTGTRCYAIKCPLRWCVVKREKPKNNPETLQLLPQSWEMKALNWRSLGNQKKKTTTVEPIIVVCGASHASIYLLSVLGIQCWIISFGLQRWSKRLWVKCTAFEHWSEHLLSHHRIAPCVGNPSCMSEPWRAKVWGGVCAHYLTPSNIESCETAILP